MWWSCADIIHIPLLETTYVHGNRLPAAQRPLCVLVSSSQCCAAENSGKAQLQGPLSPRDIKWPNVLWRTPGTFNRRLFAVCSLVICVYCLPVPVRPSELCDREKEWGGDTSSRVLSARLEEREKQSWNRDKLEEIMETVSFYCYRDFLQNVLFPRILQNVLFFHMTELCEITDFSFIIFRHTD